MANDLSIYLDGRYVGYAGASAREVCLHDDDREYDAAEILEWYSYPLLWALWQEGRLRAGRKVKIIDENKY